MDIKEFEKHVDEFFDDVLKGKHGFIKDIQYKYIDVDVPMYVWVQMFLDWSEVTTDIAEEYHSDWCPKDEL